MELVVEYEGIKVPVKIDEEVGAVIVNSQCPSKVKQLLDRFTYGVEVASEGDTLIAVPLQKSGLTEEGRQLVSSVYPEAGDLIYHNPLPLIVLAVVLGVIVLCQIYPEAEICKGISEAYWKVLLPLLAFGLGLFIGYHMLEE